MQAIIIARTNTKKARVPMMIVFWRPVSLFTSILLTVGSAGFSFVADGFSSLTNSTLPYLKLVGFGTCSHCLFFSSGLVPGAHGMHVP